MTAFPRGKTAIVSTGTFGFGEAPGYSSVELAAQASLNALAQVGLKPSDVDAVFGNLRGGNFAGLQLAEYFGINPKLTSSNNMGGSSFEAHVLWGALALEARQCDVVLIAYGSNLKTGVGRLVAADGSIYEAPYKARRPLSGYALAAARHMHQYGTTRRQLAEVAVAARKWAQLNPEAVMRTPLTIDEVLSARMVADPLTTRDCCLVTDGAGAIVMTRADKARDLVAKPAYVLGAAEATDHLAISSMPDLTVTPAAMSGPRAFAQAGIGPKDLNVVQLYDAFTINTILFLEDLGFCPKGEGGRFVEDGAIAPGGRLAVNTNGGGLSCVHPGMYGMFLLVEATRQLMGQAGDRQIKGAELALAHGNGVELSSQATVILGGAATL
jgi:acetyl-CoA acetyltransferase